MPTSDRADPLLATLGEISALGGRRDRENIDELRHRLAGQRLRVLVAGEAKRGKSTLVNAMLGRAVLPAGVTPLTALATTVAYGRQDRVTAAFADGRTEAFPLSALDDLVTERGNPGNVRDLSSVSVSVPAPLLARGIELVDTPGAGSVYGHNTAEAQAALQSMDAAVFVLTSDPPVSASERELIAKVASLSVTMFVVLNKADRLSVAELAEVADFTARVTAQAAGQPVPIYPLSARAALAGPGDAGFAAFEAAFAAYLEHGRAADLRQSVRAQARRMACSLRDEAVLSRRVTQMRGAEAAERVTAFTARLAAVRNRRQDASDLVMAESRRMLGDLNEAAERAGRECAVRVGQRLRDLLGTDLRTAPAAEVERTGWARLADLAVAEAQDWRQEWTGALEARLARLDERLTGALLAELDAVRRAAADLLGLDLALAAPGQQLAPDLRFFYQTDEPAGQTELLAGAIRRHLPGRAGRARAAGHLRRETADLVARQVGRARSDLQYRLQEATRRLARAIDGRYQEGTGRLEKALADADGLSQATAGEVAVREGDLASRIAAIDRILAVLGPALPPRRLPGRRPVRRTAAAAALACRAVTQDS